MKLSVDFALKNYMLEFNWAHVEGRSGFHWNPVSWTEITEKEYGYTITGNDLQVVDEDKFTLFLLENT